MLTSPPLPPQGTSVTHATLVEEPDQPGSELAPHRRHRHSPRLEIHSSGASPACSPQHVAPVSTSPDPAALGATSVKMGDANDGSAKRRRIVFLGSGKVGKTSLIKRFLDNTYNDKYRPTVEDLFTREYEINGRVISVEIMDTSGSYNFPAMRRICIGKASAFVLTCAQDDPYSFEYVKELLHQIKEERADYDELPLVIAVNKIDLQRDARKIADEDIDAWLHEESVPLTALVYTSAKDEDGVWTVFEKLWERSGLANSGNSGGSSGGMDFATALTDARPPVSTKRRFSAFAVLTTSPGPLLRGSISGASTPDGENSGGGGGHWPLTPKKKSKSGRRFSNKSSKSNKTDGPIKVDCVIS